MSEVRRGKELVFAILADGHRIKEYVPKAKFVNGTAAERVLLEYDQSPEMSTEWPRLIDLDLACGPGIIAAGGYVGDRHPTIPEAFLSNMKAAALSETEFQGKACYWFHVDNTVDKLRVRWDLYVNRASGEPVRQTRLVEQNGAVDKDDVYDFTFEHLSSDNGIRWELDPTRLK